jgi:hypothetical protein
MRELGLNPDAVCVLTAALARHAAAHARFPLGGKLRCAGHGAGDSLVKP